MKNITVAGRLGKDARLAHTQSGDAILSFPVAVDDGYGENKSTMWFDCSIFGKRATALSPHLKKGNQITAVGDLRTREHEGKTYLQVRVSELDMQGGRQEGSRDTGTSYDDRGGDAGGSSDLDDIPF